MTDTGKGATTHTPLGDGKEFDAIRGFLARWGATATGIGDDAATIELPRGERLVVSVDSFVSGRHFEPAWLTPAEVGYRATIAALSDLAAMAAAPLGILFAVNVADAWRTRLGDVANGVAQAAREARTVIVGGNISGSTEFSITTTVLGSAFEPLTRRGAVAGNLLYVTGQLGGPGSAVAAWKAGNEPTDVARERFAHPVARIREARWLADRGATACIDISDGLIADAGQMAAASARAITIHLDRVPILPGMHVFDAARSGEEYELLVAAPRLDAAAFTAAFGLPLTEIGRVSDGDPGVTALESGTRVAAGGGHDHFSG